jgi:hypothetical protein
MKPTLAIVFLAGLGVGGGTASLIDAKPLTFPAAPVTVAQPLETKASARFEPLTQAAFEYVHVIWRGTRTDVDGGSAYAPLTHARYKVASAKGGVPYVGEHFSYTNGETLESLLGLNRAVIFPAAKAQCPDLADAEAYPALEDGHVEYSGVEADKKAVARLVVPSLLAGLPPVTCDVRTPAPAEAMALVAGMVDSRVIPAVKEETGLR